MLLFYLCSTGQKKFVNIPINSVGDTSYWFKRLNKYTDDKKLFDLTKNLDSVHLRISTITEAVDVWTNDYKNFKGEVTAFVKCGKDQSQSYTTVSKSIDTNTAAQIFRVLNNDEILAIPTDNKIKGWGLGFDGTETLIEYSTPKHYSFKEYWSPYVFKEIKEAQLIDTTEKQVWALIRGINFSDSLLSNGCAFETNGVKGILIKTNQKKKKAGRQHL
ncbi:MAG: hypothetical protein EOP45_04860 [Sphingobacteriaceae bacterium]|nr:MAG: hypothetical protein EOP45_04860 [Sphingobacteriaceae bacterium]